MINNFYSEKMKHWTNNCEQEEDENRNIPTSWMKNEANTLNKIDITHGENSSFYDEISLWNNLSERCHSLIHDRPSNHHYFRFICWGILMKVERWKRYGCEGILGCVKISSPIFIDVSPVLEKKVWITIVSHAKAARAMIMEFKWKSRRKSIRIMHYYCLPDFVFCLSYYLIYTPIISSHLSVESYT